MVTRLVVDKWEYKKLLDRMGLDWYPKTVGNPMQTTVRSYDELWEFWCEYNNETSLYVCHNSFPTVKTIKGKDMPMSIQINNIFNDFDSDKLENAQLDAIKLSDGLTKLDICHSVTFTAGKGFHLLIQVQPATFSFIDSSERDSLTKLVYAIQLKCKNLYGLRTMDERCMKDVRKIMRLPYTYYYNRAGIPNGRMCVPLDSKMLRWNIKEGIVPFSLDPFFIIPPKNGDILTLEQLALRLEVDFDEVDKIINSQYAKVSDIEVKCSDAEMYLQLVEEHKPCIANAMRSLNPNHHMRVAFAVYLMKRLGKSAAEFKDIYYKLAEDVGYVDRHNREYGEYQIEYIFNRDYKMEANCSTIKKYGFCLGGCTEGCTSKHKRGVCKHGKCLRYRWK